MLELMLDVKRRRLPIVLISHNMPHVFEVADRIHIHRLGRRIAVIRPKDYSMSGGRDHDRRDAAAASRWKRPEPSTALEVEPAKDRHEALGREARPDRGRRGHRQQDFIIADAKDPTWVPASPGRAPSASPTAAGPATAPARFLDQIRAIVRQDIVDIMLMSASTWSG